jgi:hypothetical protein
MKYAGMITAIVLLTNLVLVTVMYLTVGWHFIRGYNEVSNFLVVPCVIVLAGLNFLVAAPIVLVARWRRASGARVVVGSLCLSAVVILSSLTFAPVLGSAANRNLWIDTPLVEAARYGDAELVITLVNKGANPNAKQSALGTTALHYMAACGELQAVEALLEKGADCNARANASLETPLHWAVRSRVNVMTIKLLLNHGADPALEDWHGQTPVQYTETIPNPLGAEIRNTM